MMTDEFHRTLSGLPRTSTPSSIKTLNVFAFSKVPLLSSTLSSRMSLSRTSLVTSPRSSPRSSLTGCTAVTRARSPPSTISVRSPLLSPRRSSLSSVSTVPSLISKSSTTSEALSLIHLYGSRPSLVLVSTGSALSSSHQSSFKALHTSTTLFAASSLLARDSVPSSTSRTVSLPLSPSSALLALMARTSQTSRLSRPSLTRLLVLST